MVSFPVSWIVCPAIPRFFFLAFRSSAALPAKAGSVQSIAPGAARLRGDLTGSACRYDRFGFSRKGRKGKPGAAPLWGRSFF
ncbi:hypothetical protein DW792_10635 [Bifidobacterium longum]|nr:hypothetical protein DW792_10635 [Bifidobacterium longum]